MPLKLSTTEDMGDTDGAFLPSRHPSIEKVPQHSASFAGEDRLRMELNAVHRPPPMPQAHDRAVAARARADLEVRRQSFLGDDERVVARGDERNQSEEHTSELQSRQYLVC